MNTIQHHSLFLLNNCKTLKTLKQIHAHLVTNGLSTNLLVAGKLILHCAITISDGLHYATRFLSHFPNPDVFMYNTLIRGFSASDTPQNSLTTFIQMRKQSSTSPDSFSFAFILKAAANHKSLKSGIQIHTQVITHGLDSHLFVGTTLVSMYGECGCVEFAQKVFEEIPQPNVVAWNALLTACFRGGGSMENAKKVFDKMPVLNLTSWNVVLAGYTKGGELDLGKRAFLDMPVKDDVSWSTMITGFAHNGWFDDAFGCFRELQRSGMKPNEVSLTGVLFACAQSGAFEFGKILHGFIEKSGINWIVSVNNALIDTYSKCGNVDMARLVFRRMNGNSKSVISWTAMIAGLAMHGYGEEAIKLFIEMEEFGIKPDGIVFISILYACSHAGLIEKGCEYFHKMKNVYNIEPDIEHYGCMVDLYGRAGLVQKAYDFLHKIPIKPNVIIWRTLLGACSIHGNIELAEKVKQTLSELDPNNSGDHVLLSNIYAVAGKWNHVADVRKSMSDLRIKKKPGWSMVEVDKVMYSFVAGEKRNGFNEEAYEKLKEIMLRLKVEAGYIPQVLSTVLYDIEDEEKEDRVAKHSEKLAVSFGIARLGKNGGMMVIRIVKNLRVCRDCHVVMKLISKVYGHEIVVRDRSRFHLFKDGSCSCRDYW